MNKKLVYIKLFFALLFLPACGSLLARSNVAEKQSVSETDTAQDSNSLSSNSLYAIHVNPYEGSLWTPHNSRAFLFGDNKARNINDIVMVNIVEQSDASRSATTNLTKKSGIKSNITKFFGSPLTFGMGNLWGKNTGASTYDERTDRPFKPELETNAQNSYNGSGSTIRKDKLLATISAKVVNIYPNGNMHITGNREVTINNEKQFIKLSGIIRPEDISVQNVILSTAIADAKISISGKGVISDKQNPGYGHRFFDWLWPF